MSPDSENHGSGQVLAVCKSSDASKDVTAAGLSVSEVVTGPAHGVTSMTPRLLLYESCLHLSGVASNRVVMTFQ